MVQRAEGHGFWSVSVPDHLGPSLPQSEVHERYGISSFTVSGDLAWKVAPVVEELSR